MNSTSNTAVLERLFAAVGAGDADAQVKNYTDDVVLELPYSEPPARVSGREAVREYLAAAFTAFEMRLTTTEVYEAGDTLVVEFTSTGRVIATDTPYANTYIAVLKFRDGLICHHREFYNPIVSARALGLA